MSSNKAIIPFLVGMMLLTGVCNTLLTKYQDLQCVRNCDAPNPKHRQRFEQPVWQTIQMFIGESGCWLVVGWSAFYSRFISRKTPSTSGYEPVSSQSRTIDGSSHEASLDGVANESDRQAAPDADPDAADPLAKPLEPAAAAELVPLTGWRVAVLALPATCDLTATTLMNVGLLFVAASIYQMTRGALVLFVGLFSVLFLRARLGFYKWLALVVVVLGVGLVGLAGIIEDEHLPLPPPPDGTTPPPSSTAAYLSTLALREAAAVVDDDAALQTALGIFLIFGAQVFTASQFVLEEAVMRRYSMMPISVVGWEGLFGLTITLLALGVGHVAYGGTAAGRGGYFDAVQGWADMTQHAPVVVSSILIMISIGGFNFFGLSVTRSVSATSRSTIDTCRTLFIWVVSLGLGWESFKWLQVVGFAMLVYGTFLFNDIVRPPRLGALWCCGRRRARVSQGPSALEHDGLLPERPVEHNP